MRFKNLLTGILLAGSALAYGQAPNDNSKKISELYGKRGEKIVYKDYSKIPWEQIDTNERAIFRLENILEKPYISNKEAFRDSVFAEAEKLGYAKEQIEKLNPKEAVDLAIKIVTSRYEYDYIEREKHKKGDSCLHDIHKNNDFYFFKKLGICSDYSESLLGVWDLFKEDNKNLKNVYANERINREHAWNQLLIFTKDSLFFSDIDPTFYDGSGKIEARKGKHFDYEIKVKISALKGFKDISLNYSLYKELYAQMPDAPEVENKLLEEILFYEKLIVKSKLSQIYMEQKMLSEFPEDYIKKDKDSSLFYSMVENYKKKSDSLLFKYKKINKSLDSLTKEIIKDYAHQKEKVLNGIFVNALALKDTAILEDATKYFVKGSTKDYFLRRSLYFLYKDNKNKDKFKELKKEFRKEDQKNGYKGYYKKKDFEEYKRIILYRYGSY